jgi:hypothetical protein
VRFRDLVVASRDLFVFVSSKNSFVNSRDLLVIFDLTDGINISNCFLLLINRAIGFGGENF